MAAITTAAIGAGVALASAAKSFSDAAKQKKAQKEAEAAGAAAMKAARQKLDKNMYESLAVNKEPYEMAQETIIAQGAQATEAARESERGVAATAGAVQQATNEATAGLRTQMGTELMDIQEKVVTEDANLQKLQANLDVGEAEGAAQAAADAQAASAAAMSQGFASATSAAQQGLDMAEGFGKTPSAKITSQINKKGLGMMDQAALQKSVGAMGTVNGVDFSSVSTMAPNEYNQFMIGKDARTLRALQNQLRSSTFKTNPPKKQ
jgi:hypothetical protein